MEIIQVKDLPKKLPSPPALGKFSIKLRDKYYDGLALAINDRIKGVLLKNKDSTFILGWRDFLREYAQVPILLETPLKLEDKELQKYLPVIIRLQEIQNAHPLRKVLPQHIEVEVPSVELKSNVTIKILALSNTQKRLINTVMAGINKDDYVRLKDVEIAGSLLSEPVELELKGTIFAKAGTAWIPYLFNELETSMERVLNKPVKVMIADLYVLVVKTLPLTTTNTNYIL